MAIAIVSVGTACGDSSTDAEETAQAVADESVAAVADTPDADNREADPIAPEPQYAVVEAAAEQSQAEPEAVEPDAVEEEPDDETLSEPADQPDPKSSDQSADPPDEDAQPTSAARFVTLGGERPARLRLPQSYDEATPMPLVMLLHGYTSTSRAQDSYFGLSQQADRDGFLLILPEGRVDSRGEQFWNGTDACCDLFGVGGDDSSYLIGLIEEAQKQATVDAGRVWVIGHSNGGFMAYRLACDGAPISAIVSLAGSEFADEAICDVAPPLHVLQIHGDQDSVIAYGGVASLGPGLGGFPSAETVVERWARRAGCVLVTEDGGVQDLDRGLPGPETYVTEYAQECADGASAELWTIRGGAHVPPLTTDFAQQVVGWLMSR